MNHKTMSVGEILETDIGKISTIAESVTNGAREVQDSIEAMRPKSKKWDNIYLTVSPKGADSLRRWAKTWRISRESLIRLCVHRVGEELGFDVSHVLKPKDTLYTMRTEHVPKPFETKEKCIQRINARSRDRVFTCESPRSRRMSR